MLCQYLQAVLDLLSVCQEPALSKADHTFIAGCDSVIRGLDFQEDIALYTDGGVFLQQVNFQALSGAVEVDDRFSVLHLRSEGYRNNIRILFSLHGYAHCITAIQNIKDFFLVRNFPVFTPHSNILQITSESALNLFLLPAETASQDAPAAVPETPPGFSGKHDPKSLFP